MATAFQTPGVYRQETVPAETGRLRTGVPAFIGYAVRGAGDSQVLLTRPEDLASVGIDRPDDSWLAAAIEGFFANGGARCVVAAVDAKAAVPETAFGDALEAISRRDDIDLIAMPDAMRLPADVVQNLQRKALALCASLGDRIAILDSLPGGDPLKDIQSVKDQRAAITLGAGTIVDGALYFPWIALAAGRFVPPCGHVAGILSRTDEAVGVFKAPANAVITQAIDLQTLLDDADQGELNPLGINCLRALPGRGIRVWGARTLSTDPDWRYLSVRRLFLTMNRWIDLNLAWVVFEPNDSTLWARIERDVTAYLRKLWQAGGLIGDRAADAFFVICDARNNPPESREAGNLIVEIGIAPSQPAEFITVRINLRAVETEDS